MAGLTKTKKLVEGLLGTTHKKAQENATRLLGLPPDNTAMDRAKALGFDDKTYYHGTTNEIPSGFDFSMVNNRNVGSHGIHMTNNPLEAAIYSQKYTGKGPNYVTQPDGSIFPEGANIIPLKVLSKNSAFSQSPYSHASNLTGDELMRVKDGKYDMVKIYGNRTNNWLHDHNHIKNIEDGINSYPKSKDFPFGKEINTHVVANTGALIRSPFAAFDPMKLGIGAGSVMSADLLAKEKEYGALSAPDRNSILGYMADAYKYMADEGGLLGNILYSGGGKALDNLSYGTTPMKKGSGRLPSTPTNESLLNLMELFQL